MQDDKREDWNVFIVYYCIDFVLFFQLDKTLRILVLTKIDFINKIGCERNKIKRNLFRIILFLF